MSRERQKKQSEEVRGQILDAARRIIKDEGIEALSIRSITKMIDYSSGIVYHYFKDKDEILSSILLEFYGKIISSVRVPSEGITPEEAVRTTVVNYIESMLAHSLEYKALMLSTSPKILELNSVLGEGDVEKRPALKMLAKTLEEGIASGTFTQCDIKLTVCSIWSSVFGLLMRLIIEGDNVNSERRSKLIENQINMIMKGLKA